MNSGFTLIELMVAMVVAIIVIGAIYATYLSQTRVQVAQEVTVELQESLRAALTIMEREIRTAGADPTGNAGAEILIADSEELHFTRDITGGDVDGRDTYNGRIDDPSEDIRYERAGGHFVRSTGGDAPVVLLDDVTALNFVYLDQAGGVINPNLTNVPGNRLNDIHRVEVTIVNESSQSDRGFLMRHTDTETYRNQQGEAIFGPDNANRRRLRLSTTIMLRNMPK